MTKKPQISIIVAGYNAEPYILKTLSALREQTLKSIEIICVDDASTDKTCQIIQDQAKKDSRIHLYSTPKWSGVSTARNIGLQHAKADYIMFCDADDYYEPEMCEKMLQAIQKPGVDLAICETNVVYHAHHEMKPSDDYYYGLKFSGYQDIDESVIITTDHSVDNKIFRRKLLDQYQIRFPEGLIYEDAYFCVTYFCVSHCAFFVNERLYNYVRHEKSIMSDTFSKSTADNRAIQHMDIIFLIFDFLKQHDLLGKYQQLFWELFAAFEHLAISYSKTKAGRQLAKARAIEFISAHPDLYNQANINFRNSIEHMNYGRVYVNSDRLKRLLLKFMPTLRMQIDGMLRLRVLDAKNQQLSKRLNRAIEDVWLDK